MGLILHIFAAFLLTQLFPQTMVAGTLERVTADHGEVSFRGWKTQNALPLQGD